MHTVETVAAQTPDYRASHLAKGGQYDANLAESPFDAYMSAWERQHLPAIVHRFYPDGPDRYLDFACGTGRIAAQIAPLSKHSTAVDISPTMVAEARKKCPDTRFFVGDLTEQDPDLGQFDLATSFRFFGNAQDELREGALAAIAKRIVSGGHLVINSHRNPRALYALLDRLKGGKAGEMDLHLPKLRALLARHQLHIVAMQPIGAWMFRHSMMVTAGADPARAARHEARFGSPVWAPIAPDTIIVACKR